MRVGVDLDGVCYNFVNAYRHHLITNCGFTRAQTAGYTAWSFYKEWGQTTEEFLRECHNGANQGIIFAWGKPFPGVRKALTRIADAGHTLHVITDRSFGKPGTSEAHTAKWIAAHLPPVKSVTFTNDKRIVDVDMMIDDKIENYDDMRSVGVEAYLLNAPQNCAVKDKRKRVDSLDEFADKVLAKKEPRRVA